MAFVAVEVEVEEDTGFEFEVHNYFVLAAVHTSMEVVVDPAAVVAGIGQRSFAAAAAAADYSILVGHKAVAACRKFGLVLDFDCGTVDWAVAVVLAQEGHSAWSCTPLMADSDLAVADKQWAAEAEAEAEADREERGDLEFAQWFRCHCQGCYLDCRTW